MYLLRTRPLFLALCLVPTLGCRTVNEMMTPPAVAASRGPRCRPTPLNPTADARATLLAVESLYDQYLLLLPYDPDWYIRCADEPAMSGVSRNLQLQTTIRVADWNAASVRPEDYLREVAKRAEAGYAARGWVFRDAAVVNPMEVPILQYRVEGIYPNGSPFTQYVYATMRSRTDGRLVELTIALNNPNPATLAGREGALYYYLSRFHVNGQHMKAVNAPPPAFQ